MKYDYITGLLAYNLASFFFEYDYYDAKDAFGSENAALPKLIEALKDHPQDIIDYLEEFEMPEADRLIRSIQAL